ncbi:hypothetical protein DAF82_01000 [Clostridioides difficile]|uniref:HNH endonuclease n=1 Tax=Clostridioides difficile TaxID=1496 RepID=UPI00093A1EE7|nr:HNH endonuclease [Clostridioides difficile]EGT4585066.1 hypothetical protein [Clostridioides difficile]EGT5082478.1 hypothetical protein [Clostridioides difficile]EGT5454257.1 hypothetical protein [Clostridioides difficile]EGT5501153.1 hypothetical protein [Clostridioides difficile]EJA6652137.1 hypothetical protein [Clostridioides difficile]
MKVCKKCNKELSCDNFTNNKNLKDGYENMCKKCRQEQRKKYENTCVVCGNPFKTAYKKSKYCSVKCKPQCTKDRVIVSCSNCGKEKSITKSRLEMYKNFYCSDECKNKHYKILYSGDKNYRYNQKKRICIVCNKLFKKNEYEIFKYGGKYCSLECRNEDYKSTFSGENNPNFNPNKTDEEREQNRNVEGYNEWVRTVFRRDNYTCRCCGDDQGGNLNAHHIYNYSEYKDLRTDIKNGITFCETCHLNFHKTYRYRNNNKMQVEEFLNKHGNAEPSQ